MIRVDRRRTRPPARTDLVFAGWLRGSGFRQLLAARLTSQAADGVFEAALAGYVLFSPDRAADAGTIAVGLAVVLLPFSVVGPFAGVLLDRFDRRRTLTVCGLLRAAIAVLAALALSLGGSELPLVVVAIALLACSRLVLSGVSAALPLVVAGPDLVAAGGFSTTIGTAATAVGLGVGAGVRTLSGASDRGLTVVALAAALAYAGSALVCRPAAAGSWGPVATAGPARLGVEVRRAATEVAEGARHLWSRPRARNALLAVNGGRLGYGVVFISTLLLLRSHAPASPLLGLGGVTAGLAVGTVLGAVAAPRLARRIGRPAVVSTGLVLGGVAAALLAPAGQPLLLVLASPVLGFGQQISKVSSDALIQLDLDDDNRGRAFTIVDMAFSVTSVGSAVIAAAVVPSSGLAPTALALAGAWWALCGVIHARTSQH